MAEWLRLRRRADQPRQRFANEVLLWADEDGDLYALNEYGEDAPIGSAGDGAPTSLTDLTDVTGTPGPNKSPVSNDAGTSFPLTEVTTQEDLDAILATISVVEWHKIGDESEPPLLSGFRPTGDPWCVPRYRLTLNNVVYLEGSVTNDDATISDATWIPIFQLPPEAAPGVSLRFVGLSNDDSISKLIVWNDGTVVWGGYALGLHGSGVPYVSLDGISFSVDAGVV